MASLPCSSPPTSPRSRRWRTSAASSRSAVRLSGEAGCSGEDLPTDGSPAPEGSADEGVRGAHQEAGTYCRLPSATSITHSRSPCSRYRRTTGTVRPASGWPACRMAILPSCWLWLRSVPVGAWSCFVGVEVWRVAGKLLQADALGAALSQEVLDRLAAMDRGAIPDDQQLAGDVAQQVLEEPHDVRALVGMVLHEHEQTTGRGDAADDGQMIAAQGQAEDGRLAPGRVRPDGPWEQVEARFVDPDDGPPFLVSPLFRAGQRSVSQVSIAASSR